MKHQQLTEELRERIALYTLGGLPPEQAVAFADHLAEGCQTCAREVKLLTSVVSTLGYAAAPIPPRPELRARLLSHIQGMSAERTGNDHGVRPDMQVLPRAWTVVRAIEGTWEITGEQGVVTKRLSPVLTQPCSARLVRMRGEAHYPPQRHDALQQLYMLAGALTVADQVLHAGDYCVAPGGTLPALTSGASGCICLVLAGELETGRRATTAAGAEPALVSVRTAERVWRQSGIRGVELSPLYTDPTRHTMTALVRMAPGAQFPQHRHMTDEQFYMLEGDGHVQGQVLHAGDYYLAAAGTVHDVTYTAGGCLFLLLASYVEVIP